MSSQREEGAVETEENSKEAILIGSNFKETDQPTILTLTIEPNESAIPQNGDTKRNSQSRLVSQYSFETVSVATAPDELVHEQAKKLFKLCDTESRGFLVKMDLERLHEFLSSDDVEQLESRIEKTEQKFFDEAKFLKLIEPLLMHRGLESDCEGSVKSHGLPATLFANGESSLADELAVMDIGNERDLDMDKSSEHMQSHPLIPSSEQIPVNTLVQNYVNAYSVDDGAPPATSAENWCFGPGKVVNTKFRPSQVNEPMIPVLDEPFNVAPQSLADELSEAGIQGSSKIPPELEMRVPDRIFKVVFVGDSAVGKTCFLHRFCHNRFKPLFNATIGVDFTVKTIQLKDRLIAVQLWDTAGQERFRSITKQYFRKADGVVLMYDVTSEQSFLHVRNWIDSVRTGVDDNVVMCLVGNKADLFASEQQRELTRKAGRHIADEFGMMFHETSAYTGYGINECMMAMAIRLQKREDDHLEEALRLEMEVSDKKRSWCCL